MQVDDLAAGEEVGRLLPAEIVVGDALFRSVEGDEGTRLDLLLLLTGLVLGGRYRDPDEASGPCDSIDLGYRPPDRLQAIVMDDLDAQNAPEEAVRIRQPFHPVEGEVGREVNLSHSEDRACQPHCGGIQRPDLKSLPSQVQAVPAGTATEIEDAVHPILFEQPDVILQLGMWRKLPQVTFKMKAIPGVRRYRKSSTCMI